MALNQAIEQARRQTATRANRDRQARAELRFSELVSVADIATHYEKVDRAGDLAVESAFVKVYQLVDTEPEREAIKDAYLVWARSEKDEERVLRGAVDNTFDFMKGHNPVWLDGAAVPADSDGAA